MQGEIILHPPSVSIQGRHVPTKCPGVLARASLLLSEDSAPWGPDVYKGAPVMAVRSLPLFPPLSLGDPKLPGRAEVTAFHPPSLLSPSFYLENFALRAVAAHCVGEQRGSWTPVWAQWDTRSSVSSPAFRSVENAYTGTHTHRHTCTDSYIHTHRNSHSDTCTDTFMYTRINWHLDTRTRSYTCRGSFTQAETCTHVHIIIYTHVHTYIGSYTRIGSFTHTQKLTLRHVHRYIHVDTRTAIRTRAHSYTHAQAPSLTHIETCTQTHVHTHELAF